MITPRHFSQIKGWNKHNGDSPFVAWLEDNSQSDAVTIIIGSESAHGQLKMVCPSKTVAQGILCMIFSNVEEMSLEILERIGFRQWKFKQLLTFKKTRIKVEICISVSMMAHEVQADEIEDGINDQLEDAISEAVSHAEDILQENISDRLEEDGIDASSINVSVGIDRYDC